MPKTGSQNGVVDQSFGTELPVSKVPDEILARENSMAQFTKTDEFTILKEYLEGRIEFFQKHFPNGDPISGEKDLERLSHWWIVANLVIGEFNAVLNAYTTAKQAVIDGSKQPSS